MRQESQGRSAQTGRGSPKSGLLCNLYRSNFLKFYNEEGNRRRHDETTNEGARGKLIILSFERDKGPKHSGLSSLIPSNSWFDRLMKYQYYQQSHVTGVCESAATRRTRTHIKGLKLVLEKSIFDGSDQMLVFSFLTRFV